MKKEIEKPWAVYGWFMGPYGIGRILRDHPPSLNLQYSEQQLYPLQIWDPKWVKRFSSSSEAIDYFLSKRKDCSRLETESDVIDNFPKAIRKESLQKMHDVLSAYAQTSPKCTRLTSPKIPGFNRSLNLSPDLADIACE